MEWGKQFSLHHNARRTTFNTRLLVYPVSIPIIALTVSLLLFPYAYINYNRDSRGNVGVYAYLYFSLKFLFSISIIFPVYMITQDHSATRFI